MDPEDATAADPSSGVASREVACLLDWLAPPPGGTIGFAGASAPHREELISRGFLLRELDPTRWRVGPPGQMHEPASAETLEGIVLLDQALWPYWEVEELHRLRMRRCASLLLPGRRLVFGEREMLGRADLELARLLRQASRTATEGAPSPPNPRRGRFTYYSPVQARTILGQCGFELERIRNGLDGDPSYQFERPGMIFVCRRI